MTLEAWEAIAFAVGVAIAVVVMFLGAAFRRRLSALTPRPIARSRPERQPGTALAIAPEPTSTAAPGPIVPRSAGGKGGALANPDVNLTLQRFARCKKCGFPVSIVYRPNLADAGAAADEAIETLDAHRSVCYVTRHD